MIAPGSRWMLRAVFRARPSVRLSSRVRSNVLPNMCRPLRTWASARNPQYKTKSSTKLAGTGGPSTYSTRWPNSSSSPADFSVSSRTFGLHSRCTERVTTAIRNRCLPGPVTSPTGASLWFRQIRSASR